MLRRITIVGIAATVVLLLVWDIAAYLIDGNRATISDVLLTWATYKPVVAFAFGFLMGHLFWPQRRRIVPDELTDEEWYEIKRHLRVPLAQRIKELNEYCREKS